MKYSRSSPTRPSERIEVVDVLRGFALIGVLVANMTSFAGYSGNVQTYNGVIDKAIIAGQLVFVQAKFYSLFSFLFGWGMAVQMLRAEKRGVRFAPKFIRRMLVLLMFGILHGIMIWTGDILTFYALMGLLLLIFRKRSGGFLLTAVLFCLAFSTLLQAPWGVVDTVRQTYANLTDFMRSNTLNVALYGSGSYAQITRLRLQEFLSGNSWSMYYFGNVFGMFLLGLFVGKRRIFEDIQAHLPLVRVTWLIGLLTGLPLNLLFAAVTIDPSWAPANYTSLIRIGARSFGAPALMLFYVSSILLLYTRSSARARLEPLAPVGRMALTNYISHSLIGTLLFYGYGLGLYGEFGPTAGMLLSALIFTMQIHFSRAWLDRYQYGPLEWIWRVLTYLRLQPIRSGVTYADLKVPDWMKRADGQRKFVHTLVPLAVAWLILAIWGAGLLWWRGRISEWVPAASEQIVVVRVTATPQPRWTPAPTDSAKGDVQSEPGAVFQPAVYDPQPQAAAGDAFAMASRFDVERAMQDIETLSSPEFEGRQAGSPGDAAAADYIAAQFAQAGLQPGGDKGSYYQTFDVLYIPMAGAADIDVTMTDGSAREDYRPYVDFSPIVRWYAGGGQGSGPAIWLDDCAADDFAGRNLQGGVLICRQGAGSDWMVESSRRALEYGAQGLLFLTDPLQHPPDFGTTFREIWVPQGIPMFYVYPSLVADLLGPDDPGIDALFRGVDPFPMGAQIALTLPITLGETCPGPLCAGRNVLGVLPGRDPDYADQVVILGAHYDHLGAAPGGPLWAGANDNASGVAVLLEIARSWRDQGYVPRRTVLFAAWDAEELGLLGSRHYVQDPIFPLNDTIGNLNLDMVGAPAGPLAISGEDLFSAHLLALANQFELPAEAANMGRSDHTAFLEAGVPASMAIWFDNQDVYLHYHRPSDLPIVIDREKFNQLGRMASVTLIDLVESEPRLHDLVGRRVEAVAQGDRSAFLANVSPGMERFESRFWEDLQNLEPLEFRLSLESLTLSGDTARARLAVDASWLSASTDPPTTTVSLAYPLRFTYQEGAWLWDGPDLVEMDLPVDTQPRDDELQVHVYTQAGHEVQNMDSIVAAKYTEIADLLELPQSEEIQVYLLPNEEALRGSTALSLQADTNVWVQPGVIKLVASPGITESLELEAAVAQLVLADHGINAENAAWLWHGLPYAISAQHDPVATQSALLPGLQNWLSGEAERPENGASWASVDYFKDQAGWSGLGRFILAVGEACRQVQCGVGSLAVEQAMQLELGMTGAEFENSWQDAWQRRLRFVQNNLDTLMAQRTGALLAGDRDGFIASVDSTIPLLRIEQASWFDDFRDQGMREYEVRARPNALLEDGSVVAQLSVLVQAGEQNDANNEITFEIQMHFTPSKEGYRWAGAHLREYQADDVTVRHPAGRESLAQDVTTQFNELLGEFETDYGMEHGGVVLSLYDDPNAFSASISIAAVGKSWLHTWSRPGESIRLLLRDANQADSYRADLAVAIARSLLDRRSVNAEWLLRGGSIYMARRFDPNSAQRIGANLPDLVAQSGVRPKLGAVRAAYEMSQEANALADTAAWDAVRYLVDQYGWGAFERILSETSAGLPTAEALRLATGIDFEAFETEWGFSIKNRHMRNGWLAGLDALQPARAMSDIEQLTDEVYKGRLAGSQGAQAAADWIAEQFAELGLLPAGDRETNVVSTEISPTLMITSTLAASIADILENPGRRSYLQTFPISYTEQLRAPRFDLEYQDGNLIQLAYRDDFRIMRVSAFNGTAVDGDLVYLPEGDPQGLDLNGAVVILPRDSDPDVVAELFAGMGAQAVIILNNAQDVERLYAKTPWALRRDIVAPLPVIELTSDGLKRLLESTEYTRMMFSRLDDPIWLGNHATIGVNLLRPIDAETANVLALLPGSDPTLREEIVLIGAHYDYVGDDPDGRRYSGANDDAAGVAAMLELVRGWQESGYRPKRSILFAAWGAQELERSGSRYFSLNSGFNFGNILAAVQMDGIGGGEGFNLGISGDWRRDGLVLFAAGGAEQMLDEKITYAPAAGESDQVSMQEAGLPAILLSWRLADESNLPDEYANAVHPDRLGTAMRFAGLIVMNLAR